jgi:putative acetyltransferase
MTVKFRELQPASASDATAFRQLNLEWIERYFAVEEDDRQVLGDPVGRIIVPGGTILLAEVEGRVVGCCALSTVPPLTDTLELAKLAVTESFQGQKIGLRLTEQAIALARARGARRLVLTTNSGLKTARRLYENLGFTYLASEHAEGFRGHYDRGDTYMELFLR